MAEIDPSSSTPRRFSTELPCSLLTKSPSSAHTEQHRRSHLSRILGRTLDRVNVLGDERRYGHTGCVNALSWAEDGDILLSGGDDTTIRIWRMDTSNATEEYPFVCRCVINTGHQANIFSAQMLPNSSRIATAAGDKEVRVFDVKTALATSAASDQVETEYSTSQSCIKIIRCHHDRVKKIVIEDSPDIFLSLAEDGTVRQHDLRTPHTCGNESCPAPLVEIGHELSTLSLSPLTSYQLLVAGEGPYGYLYDRRHLRRTIEQEWGAVPLPGKELTTCVRKFGRKPADNQRRGRQHITGSRMSSSNGHEVILSYSGDGIYLYSTKDEPQCRDDVSQTLPSVLPSNAEKDTSQGTGPMSLDTGQEQASATEDSDDYFLDSVPPDYAPDVPIVMPRRRYIGARNVATVKDVNFLGPDDEWIASGSDDGNFFVWDKATGALHGIYEGDSSVVNMVEGHPHLPLVAVSGIDTTVKLFAPTSSSSSFSRLADAEQIMETNKRLSSTRVVRYNIGTLLAEARNAMGGEQVTIQVPDCIGQ